MQPLPDTMGLYWRMTSIKKNGLLFFCLLSNQKILEGSQRKPQSNRNKLSRVKLTCNLFLFLGCGSHLANITVNKAKAI